MSPAGCDPIISSPGISYMSIGAGGNWLLAEVYWILGTISVPCWGMSRGEIYGLWAGLKPCWCCSDSVNCSMPRALSYRAGSFCGARDGEVLFSIAS
jgi:hypothetical protein